MTLRYMKYAADAERQRADVAKVVGSMLAGAASDSSLLLPAHSSAHTKDA